MTLNDSYLLAALQAENLPGPRQIEHEALPDWRAVEAERRNLYWWTTVKGYVVVKSLK